MNNKCSTAEELLKLAESLINMAKSDPEINHYELDVKAFAPVQQFWNESKLCRYSVHTGERVISITLKRPRDSHGKIMDKMIKCINNG